MHRVYGASWGWTLIKCSILYLAYSIILGLGVAGAALLTLHEMGELPF